MIALRPVSATNQIAAEGAKSFAKKRHLSATSIARSLLALALLCWLIFYQIDFKSLIAAFSELTFDMVAALLVISVLLVYVSALKWSFFLRVFGTRVSVVALFGLYLIGYFVNLIVPSVVGGDALRSYYIGAKSGHHEAVTATLLERYTGCVAMAVLAFSLMWNVALVTWQIKVVVTFFALFMCAISFVALSPRTLALLERTIFTRIRFLKRVDHHIRRIQEGFRVAQKDTVLLLKAFALSFFFHSLTILNTVAAGYAVGWHEPPIQELFVIVPVILLVGALPITPGGLGVQEGAFYYFLTGIGATPAQAVGIAVILRANTYVLAISGGLVWLLWRPGKRFPKKVAVPIE